MRALKTHACKPIYYSSLLHTIKVITTNKKQGNGAQRNVNIIKLSDKSIQRNVFASK